MASFTLNNKLYIVADNALSCYDMDTFTPVAGFNKTIKELWPGVWHLAIDVIVNSNNNKLYFFKGAECTRFDLVTKSVDEGYPKLTAATWRGIFPFGCQAAVNVENKWVYFFKKTDVLRYNIAEASADELAAPISKTWKEWGLAKGVEDGVYLKNNKILFKTKEEKLVVDKATNKTVMKTFYKWFLYDYETHQSLRVNLADIPALLKPELRKDIKEIRQKIAPLLKEYLPCSPNATDKDNNTKYEEIINLVKSPTGETVSTDYLPTYKGTTCGYLIGWLLYKLGCKNKDLINRKVPYNKVDIKITDVANNLDKFEFTFTSGQNITKIHQAMIDAWGWYDIKNGEKAHWTVTQQLAFTKKLLDDGIRPSVGDIVFLKDPKIATADHVMVFLSSEQAKKQVNEQIEEQEQFEEQEQVEEEEQMEQQEELWHTADGGQESVTFNMGYVTRKVVLGDTAKCVRLENETYPDRQIVGWLPLEKLTFVQ